MRLAFQWVYLCLDYPFSPIAGSKAGTRTIWLKVDWLFQSRDGFMPPICGPTNIWLVVGLQQKFIGQVSLS
jgi:hypothetical protein